MIRLCQVLEISESGYYAWRIRKPGQRKREDEALGKLIEDAYQNNRQVYGSPRVHAELKEPGVHCGRKRVARLMRERGINAKPKRRKMKTTDSAHSNPVAPNVLALHRSLSLLLCLACEQGCTNMPAEWWWAGFNCIPARGRARNRQSCQKNLSLRFCSIRITRVQFAYTLRYLERKHDEETLMLLR
ncbi:MAG: IS3 family transposase [Ktedonobacteraceae bacterium]